MAIAGLDGALDEDQTQHVEGPHAQGLEHAELADALEDRHQHGVEDQDADRDVDDEEHRDHDSPRGVQHRGDGGQQLAPGLHVELARQAVHAIGGAGKIDLGGPAHDDLVDPVGDDEKLAEGAGGHEDAGAVGGITDAPEHAANGVEIVGHGAVGSLGQNHQLGAGLHPERAGQAPTQDDALGILGIEPAASRDLLVDQADPGVALDVHAPKRHAGRRLPGGGHAVGQEAGAGGESLRHRAVRAGPRDSRSACRWRDCRDSRRRRPARPPPRGRGRCAPCSGGSPPSDPRRGSSPTGRSSWPRW